MKTPNTFLACAILIIAGLGRATAQEAPINIATFNIRYANNYDAPNTWDNRLPIIKQLILFHELEIIGIQEGLAHQVDQLQTELADYAHLGIGRIDGKRRGEFAAIFYRKDRFTELESSTFWLKPQPDEPGIGWDAKHTRICTWARFRDNATGRLFYVFNTHFDNKGVEARKESAALVLEKVAEIAGDETVMVIGDFNADQASDPYRMLRDSPRLKDAYEDADLVYANNGTSNKFDPSRITARRIDHVFVSPDVVVPKYGILTDTYYGKFPSDHFPVMVKVEL